MIPVKKKIVKFRNKYEIPSQWARELSSMVKSEFSSTSIIPQYDNLFNSVVGI